MSGRGKELFQAEFLDAGRFPKLDKRWGVAFGREFGTQNDEQFLEDGWRILSRDDELLKSWIEDFIAERTEGLPAVEMERNSRSIRYGASLVYYCLRIQAKERKGEYDMPKVSGDQQGALDFDLREKENQKLGSFLASYDHVLAAMIDSFLDDPKISKNLKINSGQAFLGIYFTYYVLANRAESLGMEQAYGIS